MDTNTKEKLTETISEVMCGYNRETDFVAKFVEELKNKFRANGILDCLTECTIEEYRQEVFNRNLNNKCFYKIEDISTKK